MTSLTPGICEHCGAEAVRHDSYRCERCSLLAEQRAYELKRKEECAAFEAQHRAKSTESLSPLVRAEHEAWADAYGAQARAHGFRYEQFRQRAAAREIAFTERLAARGAA